MDKLVAKTKKLGWSKAPISLEVDPKVETQAKLMLMGNVLTSRYFSKVVVKEIIAKAWNMVNEVDVAPVDKNVFLFSFKHEVDWNRRPWCFKGEHLILKQYKSEWSLNEVDFSENRFLGSVLEEDLIGNEEGAGKRYVRVRVSMVVDNPLITDGIYGNWLRVDNNEFQSGIDLEGNIMIRDSQQTQDEAFQTAAEAWHLLCQREAMDQSESCVPKKEEGDVSKVDLMEDGARGTAEVPAISLLSLQIDHLSETTKLGSNSSTCILETLVNTELNCVVSPVSIPLASPSNIVESGPTSPTGVEIQRIASPVINVDPSGPIMDVMSKRKASDPKLEAYPSKSPRGGPYHAPNSSMRILSLNCWGARRASTARALKALVRYEGLDVLFVSEFGGLALFWKLGVDLEVVYSDNHVIAALVYSDTPNFFGLWLIIGDLNSIVKKSEKRGGSSSSLSSSSSFLTFVSNTGAIDLGFNGPRFTWSNRREGWANVREKLDRGLCNDDWQRLFLRAGIKHLSAPNSDHNPIILNTHLELQKGVRPFRFEVMWARDESSSEVVDKAWAMQVEGSHNFRLAQKFRKMQKDLIVWNKYIFGVTKSRIRELEDRLKVVQDLDPSLANLAMEASLSAKLNEWLEKEELKWKQKSRELWLKEGDRNSKFFHLSTLVHCRRNQIADIKLEDGSSIHSRDQISDYFSKHFEEVFKSSHPIIPLDLEGLVSPCISDRENFDLFRIPDASEIKNVVWDIVGP
uniref:Uncharacterized protein n=1 Tax=Fagus sylvatica TaxID=28930 RepID=A0A2N9GUT0_FAGSY